MNKILVTFQSINLYFIQTVAFFFVSNFLLSQNYHPFINFDVEWIVIEAFEQTKTNEVQFEFETTPEIINGTDYFRMGTYLFREEIDSSKVYLLDAIDSTDQVYYDFNLIIGDSIKSRVSPSNKWVYVESIDHLTVDSSTRKVIHFTAPEDSPECNEKWIEGIGSNFGPTGPLSVSYDCWHFRAYLTCVRRSIDQITIYGDCGPNGLDNEKADKEFEFSPNPTTNYITITSTTPIQQIQVYNTSGLELQNIDVDNATTSEVHLSGLPNGLYFLRIETKKETVTKRIIKQSD